MFFQPPKVKSLSRYAEYGAYLGNVHFLLMLGIAITLHVAFIVIYSLSPSQDVIRIPVHSLNLKISGGNPDISMHMPAPAVMPGVAAAPKPEQQQAEDENMKSVGAENPESAMDNALKEPERKPVPEKKHEKADARKSIHLPLQPKKGHGHSIDGSMATPKRYVRESAKPEVTANVGGEAGGKDAIERYTQVISQWIQNHQSAAREAYREAVQGQERVHGQAVIRLRIDRDGNILSNSVDHTSGNELVDEAANAMVRASNPVPAVPGDYPSDSQLEFLIAVQVDFSKQ